MEERRWHLLKEWNNLLGQDLSGTEALRIQHDLGDELAVGFGHSQAPEELLQVIRQVGAPSIARVHGDEYGHIWAYLNLLI